VRIFIDQNAISIFPFAGNVGKWRTCWGHFRANLRKFTASRVAAQKTIEVLSLSLSLSPSLFSHRKQWHFCYEVEETAILLLNYHHFLNLEEFSGEVERE
jgi:hypothetical protein